jgi:hypothetical protein
LVVEPIVSRGSNIRPEMISEKSFESSQQLSDFGYGPAQVVKMPPFNAEGTAIGSIGPVVSTCTGASFIPEASGVDAVGDFPQLASASTAGRRKRMRRIMKIGEPAVAVCAKVAWLVWIVELFSWSAAGAILFRLDDGKLYGELLGSFKF